MKIIVRYRGSIARFRPNTMALASPQDCDRLLGNVWLSGNDCRAPITMLMGSPPKINSMPTQVELGNQGEERCSGEESIGGEEKGRIGAGQIGFPWLNGYSWSGHRWTDGRIWNSYLVSKFLLKSSQPEYAYDELQVVKKIGLLILIYYQQSNCFGPHSILASNMMQ